MEEGSAVGEVVALEMVMVAQVSAVEGVEEIEVVVHVEVTTEGFAVAVVQSEGWCVEVLVWQEDA